MRALLALAALAAGTLAALAVLLPGGQLGWPLHDWLRLAFGWGSFLAPAWLLGVGGVALWSEVQPERRAPGHPGAAGGAGSPLAARLVGAALASLALLGLLHLVADQSDSLAQAQAGVGGGYLGYALAAGLIETLGRTAAWLTLPVAFAVGLLLAADLSVAQALRWLRSALRLVFRALLVVGVAAARGAVRLARWLLPRARAALGRLRRPRVVISAQAVAVPSGGPLARRPRRAAAGPAAPAEPPAEPTGATAVAPGTPAGRYQLPPLSLLDPGSAGELSEADLRHRAKIIEDTLASFGVQARVVEINPGPAVTQFGIEPGPGVAVSRILARQHDLALRLGAAPLRLEAPVPGKRVVGVEVPNAAVSVVNLRALLESEPFTRGRARLRLPLGRDVSGAPVVADLTKMPHLLIAGATGSGKSVCINTIIVSLLYQCTPDDLQLLMIDPKMVELAGYNGIPHLRMPVVTDMERVVGTLKWAVTEMERRYGLFVAAGVRNLDGYNRQRAEAGEPKLPYLVVIIDELADMMMTAPDEVERALCRLAQLARATGIHLIVATQRPSVDVLTGLIKANFPTRIAFAVTSQVDSRVIIDGAGAEKLLGRGDMLFLPSDAARPVRVQGAYLSDAEINAVIGHWRRFGGPQYSEEDLKQLDALSRSDDTAREDELYEKALELAGQTSRLSISFLQRRLGIGYNRAARLMDQLVERGVVTAEDGKPRVVLRAPEEAG